MPGLSELRTMLEHLGQILSGLVRVGIVTEVNYDEYLARVFFEDINTLSGWLIVPENRPAIPDHNVPQRTEYEAGGSGLPAFESHKHDLVIEQWMPEINQPVLVLFLPYKNADGFILGGMRK